MELNIGSLDRIGSRRYDENYTLQDGRLKNTARAVGYRPRRRRLRALFVGDRLDAGFAQVAGLGKGVDAGDLAGAQLLLQPLPVLNGQ